mmetsp:Transcript_3522/g.8979  ORF Transcript_3522/g.8979 Transcript_3522/m.8979 type:complete len:348 (-) Transcript_3522:11-1054(-)
MSIRNDHLGFLLFLAILVLCPPTSSFSTPPMQPRRLWTPPLRASGDDYNGSDLGGGQKEGGGGGGGGKFEPFERVVRRVTRNEGYKFGDLARSVVNTTTHGVEDAVRAVTHDEDYQFGDLTKKVIGSATHGIEDAVKSVTGNEEYQFGDLARGTVGMAGSVMTYSEKTLAALRDNNIHELIELMNIYWTKSMNEEERKESFTVFVYLGAILTLAYNFVANVMAGMVFAVAWTKVSMATGASPLSQGNWQSFLTVKSTMDLFFGGPCIPARAIVTIPWFFSYRKLVVALAHKSPLREKFPVINRYLSLMLSWLVANLAFVGGVTFLMVKIGCAFTGVPVFPVGYFNYF